MSDEPESFDELKTPFPWFGGKARAADIIWPRIGNVPNYVEPFAGSLAVLMRRPHAPGNEIVNDLDCYVANAWRSMKYAAAETAALCDWPVNEADLHARHRWLHGRKEFRHRMEHEPDYYDPKIAAWWMWGLSSWIGDNFCRPSRQDSLPMIAGSKVVARQVPYLTTGGKGVARKVPLAPAGQFFDERSGTDQGESLGDASSVPVAGTLEENARAGRGPRDGALVEASAVSYDGREGRGPESAVPPGQLPNIVGTYRAKSHRGEPVGKGVARYQAAALQAWFANIEARLRFTKVVCGDWSRVLTKAATWGQGVTGVLLDPPYDTDGHDDVYGDMSRGISGKVRAWALEAGENPLMRIALCGYEGEHEMPPSWECVAWKAGGGYGNRSAENQNAKRERIWFSPACLKPEPELF